jgi:electron transfer flavoprotein beta subunit
MNIITCIKQVPSSSKVDVDLKTGNLIRNSKDVKMNPYDLHALECAFTIKDIQQNTHVHAITMGPPQAIHVLNEAIYMGADEGTLISDVRFAGADVLSTAYTLSQFILKKKDFHLIICGKQTTDGDTAQVGPELAEFLKIPHIPYVKEIIEFNHNKIVAKCTHDLFDEIIESDLPCLITVDKDFGVPRLPSFRRKRITKPSSINRVSLSYFDDQNPENYGLNGSPTQVEKIFPPEKTKTSIQITGNSKKLANDLYKILVDGKFI